MKFELVVPHLENITEDELVDAFSKEIISHEQNEWPVIEQKYVTFGDNPKHPYDFDVGAIAGDLGSHPKKEADGKWYVEIKLRDTAAGKQVQTLVPYMEQCGDPIKALLDGIVDMPMPDKVFNLRIKLATVPKNLR